MTLRSPLALALITFTLAQTAPGLTSAASLYHPANPEAGMSAHPDHLRSGLSRQDVLGAVAAARKDGTLEQAVREGTPPVPSTDGKKTRAQVQQEYLNMSDSEKRRFQELYRSGG